MPGRPEMNSICRYCPVVWVLASSLWAQALSSEASQAFDGEPIALATAASRPAKPLEGAEAAFERSPSPAESSSAESSSAEPSSAEPSSAEPEVEGFFDIANTQLTGHWNGVRPALEAHGFTFNLLFTTVYQHNVHGGLNTHNAHNITGRAELELAFETEALGLWQGGSLYSFTESAWNDAIDEDVGDLFGVNGIPIGDRPVRVRELWYQQELGDLLRIKFGKMDLAVEIDTNAYANWEVTQFLNNSLINAGNLPLPDYGIGAVLGVQPSDWLYLTFTAADARADGDETGLNTAFHDEDYLFGAMELGLTPTWHTPMGDLPGAYRFILWYDPQPKEIFPPPDADQDDPIRFKRDDVGFVFNMDQLVYRERADEGDLQGLGMFARYGYAHEDANPVEHFWSLGAQYQGLVPTRDSDVLAFGFSQGILSDRLTALQGFGGRQSTYELYYSFLVFPWLTITPDFQYITDPGGDAGNRDAFVAGLRVVMAF